MAVRNAAIAAAFEEFADLRELRNGNALRIRACRNAARGLCYGVAARLAGGRPRAAVLGPLSRRRS